jgi:hypothetical protein
MKREREVHLRGVAGTMRSRLKGLGIMEDSSLNKQRVVEIINS